jgi:hypothetical protein
MLKTIVLLGLWLSISGIAHAQQKENPNLAPDDQLFELTPGTTVIRFWADLGKGNLLRLELSERADLARFENIDSLLLTFLADMKAFRDSLSDPLTGKRIDYLMDTTGLKKVRIRQTRLPANSYLLEDGEPALLRLQQDTIFILLPAAAGNSRGRGTQELAYDRLGLFLNRYDDLPNFITSGLNAKLRSMDTHGKIWMNWELPGENGRWALKSDHSISSSDLRSKYKRFLALRYAVSLQNYKNYFNPSFDLGTTISTEHNDKRNTFSADWEPGFIFSPNAQGRLQTYRNDFLVFGYSNVRTKQQAQSGNGFHLDIDFSLGYLIGRQGDYFEKHTFRFCAGSIKLASGKIRIQPCMYFNDLFRGVTPGLRITL